MSSRRPNRYDALADHVVSRLEQLAGMSTRRSGEGESEGRPATEDRASLARLKRCSGSSLAESLSVMPTFYSLLPHEALGQTWLHEKLFVVTTLFPLAPGRYSGNLAESLADLGRRKQAMKDGIDRRFGILLDSRDEELAFRLRQSVQLLAGGDVGVDWRQLAVDLLDWDSSRKSVQKRWARAYYGAHHEQDAPPDAGDSPE